MKHNDALSKDVLYNIETASKDQLEYHSSQARQLAADVFRRSGSNGPYALAVAKALTELAEADIAARKPKEPEQQPPEHFDFASSLRGE